MVALVIDYSRLVGAAMQVDLPGHNPHNPGHDMPHIIFTYLATVVGQSVRELFRFGV